MNTIREMFSGPDGVSSIRVMSFLVVLTAIAVAVIICLLALGAKPIQIGETLIQPDSGVMYALIYLVGILLAAGFGFKTWQKFGEREINTGKEGGQ